MSEVVVQRIVPGAPPPAPLSKAQKKKRKAKAKSAEPGDAPTPEATSAPPTEKTPEPPETQEAALAPEVIAPSDSQMSLLPEEEVFLKPSPIVDLIHKRVKATTKKISRISIYAATDPEKLNDDQKRTLKTLPTLEAVQKELGEVKKAVEVHESELVHELTAKRIEAEKADKARIANAVSAAEAALVSRVYLIVGLIRLRSLIAGGVVDISNIAASNEILAIVSAGDALVAEDEERKQTVINCLLSGVGDIDGLSYARILDIFQQYRNPPRSPTPVQDGFVEEAEQDEQEEAPVVEDFTVDTDPTVSVADDPATLSSNLRFIQESEIETPTTFDAVWVEKADAAGHEEVANGDVSEAPAETLAPVVDANNTSSTFDWAADDVGGLPSIANLHAKFGNPDSASPVVDEVLETPISVNGIANDDLNPAQREEDDGFTQARGRGRGRGAHHRGGDRGHRGFNHNGERGGYRGGDHGGERGGYRGDHGGDRGGYRGGDRGGYRGGDRGGERGGFRGYRGGERGGDRGGHRGRGNGEWRSHDGERGRGGRGRGRGDQRGGHGPNQDPPTPPIPA